MKDMDPLEFFKKNLEKLSDEKISKVISHMAMEYSDEVSQVVSFVFWICFMAEQDLKKTLQFAWKLAKEANPDFDHEKIDKTIDAEHKIKAKKIDPENKDFNFNMLKMSIKLITSANKV